MEEVERELGEMGECVVWGCGEIAQAQFSSSLGSTATGWAPTKASPSGGKLSSPPPPPPCPGPGDRELAGGLATAVSGSQMRASNSDYNVEKGSMYRSQ